LSDEIPENTPIVTGSSGLAVEAFYTAFRHKAGQRVFLTSGLGAMVMVSPPRSAHASPVDGAR